MCLWAFVLACLAGVNSPVPAPAEPVAELRAVVRITGPTGPSCSGTLIGTKRVLTAAHCITRKDGGVHSPGLFHVALSPGPDQLPEIRKVAQIVRAPAYRPDAPSSAERLAHDWALMTIKDPFADAVQPIPLLRTERARTLAVTGATAHVRAYGRARAIKPNATVRCRVIATDPPMIEHDCALEQGASGSGLLIRQDGQTYVVGVNVARHNAGKRVRGVSVMVPAGVEGD